MKKIVEALDGLPLPPTHSLRFTPDEKLIENLLLAENYVENGWGRALPKWEEFMAQCKTEILRRMKFAQGRNT